MKTDPSSLATTDRGSGHRDRAKAPPGAPIFGPATKFDVTRGKWRLSYSPAGMMVASLTQRSILLAIFTQ